MYNSSLVNHIKYDTRIHVHCLWSHFWSWNIEYAQYLYGQTILLFSSYKACLNPRKPAVRIGTRIKGQTKVFHVCIFVRSNHWFNIISHSSLLHNNILRLTFKWTIWTKTCSLYTDHVCFVQDTWSSFDFDNYKTHIKPSEVLYIMVGVISLSMYCKHTSY